MHGVKRTIVDGLEVACRATRFIEWMPGWHRVYPQCLFARWSFELDERWATARWPAHADDEWDEWFDGLPQEELRGGNWHHW
jgi:hypothetical protein